MLAVFECAPGAGASCNYCDPGIADSGRGLVFTCGAVTISHGMSHLKLEQS
jgi:hypothetical protein